jgi:hypothetical protein
MAYAAHQGRAAKDARQETDAQSARSAQCYLDSLGDDFMV